MADFAELGIAVDSRDVLRAQGDLRRLTRTGGETERAITRQSAGMTATWRRLAGVAGAVAGTIAGAFSIRAIGSTLASFDSSMSQVQAITRATGEEMAALRATAQEMGATTAFTASQAADGLRFLGMAGFSAAESMAAIPAVLNLATAASMGLADAADITSNIMSGFGIEAANAAGVADVLAAASSRANTDVSQLGQAMSTVAPISASLGIDLADTAAAIGVLSDAGIQGERAGTALRGVMASLAGPTTQAAEALAAIGLSAQDVNPAMHSMETIFARLYAAGLDTAGAMAIFGREASSGALVLAEGSARLGDFGRELRTVSGEAARMAGIMGDNLQGDFNRFKSAVEALVIAMGDTGLIAVFRGVTQAVTFMVLAVTGAVVGISGAVTAFGDMIGGFEGYFIAAAGAITTYFLPAIASAGAGLVTTLAPAIWSAVTATGAWVASLITLRGALIATGIGAFVVGAGYAINMLLDLRRSTGSWGETLSLLSDVARGVWAGIVESAQGIPLGLEGVWTAVRSGFASMVSSLAGMWAGFMSSMVENLGGIETPFGSIDFGAMLGLENAITGAQSFSSQQSGRSAMMGSNAGVFFDAAADRIASGVETAREALALLRSDMAQTGETTTDTEAAISAINEALAQTPSSAAAAAGGVSSVSDAAQEAQSRMENMAGNMSRFFMQVLQGADAARNAVSQLLSRAAEMLMNRALMSLLGGTSAGGGSGIIGGLLNFLFNADGGVYSSPSLSAYSGGIYSTPKAFAFADGGVPGARNVGVFAEAGPEAIMPLKRGPDGKLGVAAHGAGDGTGGEVTVNVTVAVDENGNLQAFVDNRVAGGVRTGLSQYDRALPVRLKQIQANPRRS